MPEHLVIVEGYFGVFRLYEAGIPAVALMGSSLAPEQVEGLLDGLDHYIHYLPFYHPFTADSLWYRYL